MMTERIEAARNNWLKLSLFVGWLFMLSYSRARTGAKQRFFCIKKPPPGRRFLCYRLESFDFTKSLLVRNLFIFSYMTGAMFYAFFHAIYDVFDQLAAVGIE